LRNFILGVVATVVVAAVIVYIVGHFGFIDLRADQQPSGLETSFAGRAMGASTERHAPDAKNPIEAYGRQSARRHETLCHILCPMPWRSGHTGERFGEGGISARAAVHQPPCRYAGNQNFYIIGHGVRLTAMPGWEGVLDQDQIWKVTTFLSHMDKLPSSVAEAWKASPGQPSY
jgi:hypothetical protein